jgi:DNA-directed RNA polymerase subunit beta'
MTRSPKNAAVLAKVSGTISDIVEGDEGERVITVLADQGASAKTKKETEYSVHFRRMILVKKGEKVEKGQALTDGSADLVELFKLTNKEHTQDYIINEINRIYELQGASISRKHIEVIIKQMFSRCLVRGAGDTEFTVGDVVEEQELEIANAKAKEEGKEGAQADPLILGITEVSLTRKSFLSAASFQHTTKVLINAAIRGSVDKLTGLKENVIIGRLIPAGTGFAESPKHERVTELQKVYEEEQRANEETRERTFVTEG